MRQVRAPGAFLFGAALAAMALLAGCGVKNDPVAPQTNRPPPIAGATAQPTASEAAADVGRSTLDPTARGEEPLFAEGTRVGSTDDEDGDVIAPAEVSRNPSASGRSFILDPLLN